MSAPERREGVRFLQQRGLSERRSAKVVQISRSSLKYERRPSTDAKLVERMKEITKQEKRYGYRRVWATLRREQEEPLNVKRVYRLWRQEEMSLRSRRRGRKIKTGRTLSMQATRPGEVWTYDFIHDTCQNGRKLKMLTVVDEYHRESLAIEIAPRLSSQNVLAVLKRLFAEHGAPQYLRSDNGSEFIAKAVREWLGKQGTQTLYIEPGSPWQNGKGESFNSRFRDECLNMEIFRNLQEARVIVEMWRKHYNSVRPHSSLGYQTPLEYKWQWEEQCLGALPPAPRSLSLQAPPRCCKQVDDGLPVINNQQANTSSVAAGTLGALSSGALPFPTALETVS